MRKSSLSLTDLLILILVLVFSSCLVKAGDGRDFAGHYSLTQVTEGNGEVQLMLTLHLFNYSGTDLARAAIEVHSAQQGGELLGNLARVTNWANTRDVVVAGVFGISRDEYQRWRSRSPGVFVTYRDSNGEERRAWVQLSRRPVIRDTSQAHLRPESINGE